MGVKATNEQGAARDVFAAGTDLALVAGAGTGKTSTLVLMGAATRRRGLYVAFNKPIAEEAKSRFGANVRCSTSHSLAYRAVGRNFQDRLKASQHMPLKRTAQLLGFHRDLAVGKRRLRATTQARLVMEMVQRFCWSTDEQVAARHLGRVNGLDDAGVQYLAQVLLRRAQWAWEDICSPGGVLPFKHDHYLKMWALTRPRLAADFVLLDEAQDTNPVLEEIFLAQDAQRVCVGDPAQQIYEWRHAKDIMSAFPGRRLELTQSFRFGPAIAQVANRWLRAAESTMQLTGHATGESRLGRVKVPDAVLCRGNADALAEVLRFLDAGVPVALAGGGTPLLKIAEAALDLQAGRRTGHHELYLFSSWGEVQEYAEQDSAAAELRAIVELVDAYGPRQIIATVSRMVDEDQAQVVVSTVHKSKGREWDRVRIGDGFSPMDEQGAARAIHAAEARLAYVAVTRARRLLDTTGLDWAEAQLRRPDRRTADHTPEGVPLAALPLTGQLNYTRSPMALFMSRHLPHPEQLVGAYHQHVRNLPHPVQPLDERRPDWAALGRTIDYRLRLSLGGGLGDAVTHGVRLLGSQAPLDGAPAAPVRSVLYIAGTQLLARVQAHLDGSGPVSEGDLTRLCHVAGYFEAVYRNGVFPRRRNLLAQADATTTLKSLTTAVPAYVLEDIAEQMQLAEEPFAPLRRLPAAQRVCGPVFAGSTDLGGADADFITGGLLIDCKATTRPHQIGTAQVQQLAGYLLLDYDDAYRIDRVGFYLSRQGGLITWSVTEFLGALGARASLPALRAALRDHLRLRNGPADRVHRPDGIG
ncbi:ATP-dependent helicase [Streptomyces gardneri]|uniref:UvrD-helicase domain-containing protein n=1 Tax=Streptomyces gardneri TaxID=66892 RepID=UPI0006E1356C|nr:UvrD-helicase domain-containing protein [Streptomyces gardneri]QPK43379.1 ATP-dependent helicase [Streptomyces gardneri]WRK34601.1 UvrD-helicase domain-containing protein [Streptomyces venezuelae]